MSMYIMPDWIGGLDDEDVIFIKKFLLASGSVKEIANQYGVTYPSVRLSLVEKSYTEILEFKNEYSKLIRGDRIC